jgi:glycosyltransferase involved in cell wall biosynthesis
MTPSRQPVVVHVMTIAESLPFLRGQVRHVRRRGFAVHAITSPGPLLDAFRDAEGATVHAVEMTRRITPLADLRAVFALWRTIRAIRPDVVHSHTPKGGLLGMVAGWLGRAPVRIYHLRGTPLLTAHGLRRAAVWAAEWTSCRLAHRVVSVSGSLRDVAIEERLCPPEKITVLASGSGNGVDAAVRFRPQGEAVRRATRERLGLPQDALVIGFVGRQVRDKGVVELARAWQVVRDAEPRARLLLVGPREPDPTLPADVLDGLAGDPRVHCTGDVREPVPFYAAMDVVALPTWREGFSNVALECGAMELPIVGAAVPGVVDAIQDGVTGLLVPPRDVAALAAALKRYLASPALRARHGAAGRRLVTAEFRPEPIWEAIAATYEELLGRAAEVPAVGSSPSTELGTGLTPPFHPSRRRNTAPSGGRVSASE